MKNLFIAFLLTITFMSPVFAGSITTEDLGNFNSLTETQKAQVIADIARAKEANGVTSDLPTTPEKMKEWADFGTAIGKGMAATARELGIALDEFSKSTVGKIAIGLLIYKVAGKDLLGYIFGTLWFLFGIPTWIYFFKRIVMRKSIDYIPNGDKKPIKNVVYDMHSASEGSWAFMILTGCVILVVGLTAIFS